MTTIKYTFIALALLATTAQAQTVVPYTIPPAVKPYMLPPAALPNRGALPPVEYDKPFTGKLKVIRGDRFLMDRLCPKTSYTPTLACS